MSTELEDQISRWVDDQVSGVEPITVEDAMELVSTQTVGASTAGARRRWRMPAVAAAAVVLAGAVGFVALSGEDVSQRVVSGSARDDGGLDQTDGDVDVAPDEGLAGSIDQAPACTVAAGSASSEISPARAGDPMAQIKIPKIGVDQVVVEGKSAGQLERGLGHYPATPLPGREGNSAIAGHRTTYGAPFRDLDKLEAGDQIIVQTFQGVFVYEVDRIEVVSPTEVEVLADKGDNRITLTSCHPVYSQQERIIVSGVLVGQPAPAVDPIEFGWLPTGAEVLLSYGEPGSSSQSAHVHFPDASGSSTPGKDITVRLNTLDTALMLIRSELDSDESASVADYLELGDAMRAELGLDPGGHSERPPVRERIRIRGVSAVLDRWWYGSQETTRITFFENDGLAVEISAHGISDDELYRIIEDLQLVAVGGPNG